MFVVDTNILVYAANSDGKEYDRARSFLDQCRDQPTVWYITYGILYEFFRITTHHRVFTTPWTFSEAWNYVQVLLESPGLSILQETERHIAVGEEIGKQVPMIRGNLLYDARTAIIMREHGVKTIYTRDTDFYKFPFLKVVDPLE
jgi:uncharacterized protein